MKKLESSFTNMVLVLTGVAVIIGGILALGDTFKSIGKEVNISYRKLAKHNERNKKDLLREGDIVYLKKKQTKALKQFKGHPHIVRAGESMYQISQMYGIRLKSLYEMNRLEPDYQVRVGDRLIVR